MTADFPEKTTIGTHTITIVPRYCETDQAGVVHHSVYPIYFELGRTELLRANGMAYKELEKAGYFMVVAEITLKFRRPAHYDETLELTTTCSRITPARIEHTYKLTRPESGTLLVEGSSILACVDENGRPRRVHPFLYPEE